MVTDNKLKIVIVGHVDHGKSTLIGRFFYDTGCLPPEKMEELKNISKSQGKELEFAFIMDHLQEEREQGITIDTAQAFFKTDKREYVIIDAPGHKEFLKNMITGASQAEAAVLIVDVNEGVQEQTKRHAYFLSMLGLNQVIVVLNKMDLAGFSRERFEEVKNNLLNFLKSIQITPSYIIPLSAKEGLNVAKSARNMPWYNSLTLLEALDTFTPRKNPLDKPIRFPVQDLYKINGKNILVGRIECGTLCTGQELLFLPSHKEAVINSVENFLKEKNEAKAGESIGITLKDNLIIERGEIACEKKYPPSLRERFRANIFWMSAHPFDLNDKITLRCTTQEIGCSVEKIETRMDSSSLQIIEKNANRLMPTEVGSVLIKVSSPLVIENFNQVKELGRFVLVKNNDVVAGGIVTHPDVF